MGRLECEMEVVYLKEVGAVLTTTTCGSDDRMYECDDCGNVFCEEHIMLPDDCPYCQVAEDNALDNTGPYRAYCAYHTWYDNEDIAYCHNCQISGMQRFEGQERLPDQVEKIVDIEGQVLFQDGRS